VVWDQYVSSFYFVNTIFYTVGFGDVFGHNNAEMLYCTFLFYLSALVPTPPPLPACPPARPTRAAEHALCAQVFGTLLAEVQDALGRVRASSRHRENEVPPLF
jgi:hypothetical protein